MLWGDDVVRFVLNRFRLPLVLTSQSWIEDSNQGKVPACGPNHIFHSAKAVRMIREEVNAWDDALGIRGRIEEEEKIGNLYIPVLVSGRETYPGNFFNHDFDLSHLVSEASFGTKVITASHYLSSNPLHVDVMPYYRDSTELFIIPAINIIPSFVPGKIPSVACAKGQMFFDIYLVESGKPVLTFDSSTINGEVFLRPYRVAGAHILVDLVNSPPDCINRMHQNDEKVIGITANLSAQNGQGLVYFEDAETKIVFWQFARLMSYTKSSKNPKDIINPKARPYYS